MQREIVNLFFKETAKIALWVAASAFILGLSAGAIATSLFLVMTV